MFRPCPEGMANSGPNMAIVDFFFPNSKFFSNTKSQLAPFTFCIAKRVKISKSLDSRNLIQLPNSWFPYKTLIKKNKKTGPQRVPPLQAPE